MQVSTYVWFNDWEESYNFCDPHFQTRFLAPSWPSEFQPLCDSITEKDIICHHPRFQTRVVAFSWPSKFQLCVIQLVKRKFYVLSSTLRNFCWSPFLTVQVSSSGWLNDWEESYTSCGAHFQSRVVALSWPSKFQPLCDSITEKDIICCRPHFKTHVVALSWPSKFHPLWDSITEREVLPSVLYTSILVL